jgi:methionyl-tRNA formyltransferase
LQLAEREGRFACFNIHASLLPRWRGAAPIARAIEAGDTKTGVAIMKMEAGLDTGPVLMSQEVEIHAEETSQSLHDRLAKLGANLMVEALQRIASNKVHFVPQSNDGISYANKLLKTEASINWHTKAQLIDRKVRAFNPFPGASTLFDGELIKIWRTRLPNAVEQELLEAKSAPGFMIGLSANGFWVQCQDQCLEVLELQKSGGKKMSARTWFLANSKSSSKQFLS